MVKENLESWLSTHIGSVNPRLWEAKKWKIITFLHKVPIEGLFVGPFFSLALLFLFLKLLHYWLLP